MLLMAFKLLTNVKMLHSLHHLTPEIRLKLQEKQKNLKI